MLGACEVKQNLAEQLDISAKLPSTQIPLESPFHALFRKYMYNPPLRNDIFVLWSQ